MLHEEGPDFCLGKRLGRHCIADRRLRFPRHLQPEALFHQFHSLPINQLQVHLVMRRDNKSLVTREKMMVLLLDLTKLGDKSLTFRSLTELQTVVEIRNTKKRSRFRVLLATNLQMTARLTTALLQAKRIPEATGAKARNAGVYSPKSSNKYFNKH
jgi:hypothetical protein